MKTFFTLLFPVVIAAQVPTTNLIVIDTGLDDSPYAILVTGFGPFGSIANNPSERVAKLLPSHIQKTCGNPSWKITTKSLPVQPGIISENNLSKYSVVISMGVDAGTERIRLERFARNWYSDPFAGIERKIDSTQDKNHLLNGPKIPSGIPASLEGFSIELGDENSAGTYVCNETFYRLCRDHRRGYFIHIPYVRENRDTDLAKSLAQISCKILN